MVSTRNCTVVARGRRDKLLAVPQKVRLSKVPKFFKVIYGRDCSNVLYLPPKFVREVKPLAKQIHIEDFSGQQWPVTLHRYAGGSLAFRKEWSKFFVDHDLEEGYFLFFRYIQEDHFIVEVFDRTACEKFEFNGPTPPQGKGPQRGLDIDSREKPFEGTGGDMRDGLRSDSSIASDTGFHNTEIYQPVGNGSFDRLQVNHTPMDIYLSCIMKTHYGCEEVNRSWLCDLSKFEMVNLTEHADSNRKVTNAKVVISEAGTNASDTQMPAIHPNLVGSPGGLSMDKSSENLDATVVIQHQKKGLEVQVAVEPADHITRLSSDARQVQSSRKKHTQLLSPVVKTEPHLEWELGLSAGIISFITEVKSYFCLELPVHVPSTPRRDKRKIVLLKDPSGRIWSLLYVDAFPLKALTGNWKAFCEVNGINVGDKCSFRSDNEKGMFHVEVIR